MLATPWLVARHFPLHGSQLTTSLQGLVPCTPQEQSLQDLGDCTVLLIVML
jgi:hypothetical protein